MGVTLGEETQGGIQIIARAAGILRAVRTAEAPPSLAQIAQAAGLPRSTVQRIVNALIDEALLVSAGPGGGYRLGPEIQLLAQAGRIDLVPLARPHIAALAQATGETVDLSTLRGHQVLFIDQITGTHRLRTVSAVGEIFPLTNTANGKACLTLLEPERAAALAAEEYARPGAARSLPLETLLADLERSRRTGITYNFDEHTQGISAVGTGFTDGAGGIYAISVPVPSSRFAAVKDDIIRHMLAARRGIVEALGAGRFNRDVAP